MEGEREFKNGGDGVISSARVTLEGAHERVSLWNRGAYVGAFLVRQGDGEPLAKLVTCGHTAEQVARLRAIFDEVRKVNASTACLGDKLRRLDQLLDAFDAIGAEYRWAL